METIIRHDHNTPIIIELDKPRELRLSHKALRKFSAIRHIKMSQLAEALDDYDNLSCLYYCMLSVEDEKITTSNIDTLLDAVPVKQLVQLAAQAVADAFGDDGDEGSEENPTT